MRDLNKVMLIGNVVRDPEIRTIPSGQSVAAISIATNRSWNDNAGELQKAVEYTDIVAWGKLAEIAGQILKKGRRMYVEGRLQTRNWEGQDGVKRYKTEVIASDLIVLDKPQGINMNGTTEATTMPEITTPATVMPAAESPVEPAGSVPQPMAVGATAAPAEEIDIEDIPF
ncbi:MAG: single-stranded DNA-binding protein [Patescibacteria group bacterium]|jgi:single-strand DNA-binding protein